MWKSIACTIGIVVVAILFTSCGNSYTGLQAKDVNNDQKVSDTVRIVNDSLEYEVIIIEPGFNSWLATQPQRGFRSQGAMDVSNDIKIPLYNLRVNQPFNYDASLYPFPIDYDRNINYGYEVTYLLFNYFIFFEQRYNQRL